MLVGDRMDPVPAVVLVPVQVNARDRVLAFPPHPRASSFLFAWLLGHLVVFPEDGVVAVVADAEAVSDPEDVRDRNRPHVEACLELEDAILGIVWMVWVRFLSGRLEGKNLAGVAVGLGKLLDASTTDLELVGHQLVVFPMVDNEVTDAGDIVIL